MNTKTNKFECPFCNSPIGKEKYEELMGKKRAVEKELNEIRKERARLRLKARQMNDKVKKLKTHHVQDKTVAVEKARRDENRKNERLAKARDAGIRQEERQRFSRDKEQSNKKQADRNKKMEAQVGSLLKTNQEQENKIKLLEEQAQINQTAQVLGMLEENKFLGVLKEKFHGDEFDHTKKGGDITHKIKSNNQVVGVIVYELKKTIKSRVEKKHIEQTYRAKQQRQADYGILVTNATRDKADIGFSTAKGGVIVINPAGAMALVGILRTNIIKIAELNLNRAQRGRLIKEVMGYLQSPSFKNTIEGIIQDTNELHDLLKKEANQHYSNWKIRVEKYNDMRIKSSGIYEKTAVISGSGARKLIEATMVKPLQLPYKMG